jgi:hypothetical protein
VISEYWWLNTPLGGVPKRRGEEHDAASGEEPCTGHVDGGTGIRIH